MYSLDLIKNSILRGAAKEGRPLKTSDKRSIYRIDPFDSRIHFALSNLSIHGNPIKIYSPDTLEEDLCLVTSEYFKDAITLRMATKEVQLETTNSIFFKLKISYM